jgi:lipopolysaccharide transport system permease protein
MNGSTHQAIYSITGNAALLKKTYVPKYIFTVAKITSGLIDMVFSMGALLIVMIVTRSRFTWHMLLIPYVILELYVFCLGLGLFLSQANVFFRDIQYIYNAFTTAWMYLTPLFYPLEALPDGLEWCVNYLNPMYFFIGQFRDLVYLGKLPGHLIFIAGALTPILMLLIGLWSFHRSEDRFILYI